MKKLFILIFVLIFLLSFSVAARAEESIPGEDYSDVGEVIPEEALEEIPEDIHTEEPEENYGEVPDVPPSEDGAGSVSVDTVLAGVFEYCYLNKAEIMSAAGLCISALFAALWKSLVKKISNFKQDTNDKIGETSKASNKKINELVDAYNRNAEETKLLRESIELLCAKVDEVDKKTLETEEIEESIAKILNTAYTASILPNGIKDMISTECAHIINKVHGYTSQEAVSDEEQD